MSTSSRRYWDNISGAYQGQTVINCGDFHYGPLIAGDAELGLLPPLGPGSRCLELGCGAGQNSICLARRGAACVAVDLSGAQLQAGRALAREHGCDVHFLQADLDSLPLIAPARFDLVHSAYALPFLRDPGACIARAAGMLRPGGTLLLSTAHPVAMGEWVELDDEPGMFLPSYFDPPVDAREDGDGTATGRAVPLGTVFQWLTSAGLRVDRFLEPRALPTRAMDRDELLRRVPYWSPAWLEAADELDRFPFVAVFRAVKSSA